MGTRDLRELRILVLLGWLLTRALSSPSPEWREGGSELLVGACYSRWAAKAWSFSYFGDAILSP